MAEQKQTDQSVTDSDFGGGIDQLSAEGQIDRRSGRVEMLTNMNPTPEGYLEKRKGTQCYAGYLPLRVQEISYSTDATDNITIKLSSAVNLVNTAITPIIIAGRANTSSGTFQSTYNSAYFSSFKTRTQVAPNVLTSISIPASVSGLTSACTCTRPSPAARTCRRCGRRTGCSCRCRRCRPP